MALRPRPLLNAIIALRLEWEHLSDAAGGEFEDRIARIYRHAWRHLELMHDWLPYFRVDEGIILKMFVGRGL